MKYLITYLILINLYSFFLYGYDKRRATTKKWRISENTLLLVAALGGSLGSYLGMKYFHHKTKHQKFILGIPVIGLFQILFFIYIFR